MHRGLKGDNPTAVGQEFTNSLSVMEPFILIGMSVDIRRNGKEVPRVGTHVASCPNKVLRFLFKSTQNILTTWMKTLHSSQIVTST